MRIFHALVAIFMFFYFTSEAAAPGTHVFFTQLWMDSNSLAPPLQEHSFIAGTLFPDIRYLGTIDRSDTHEKHITPQKIRKTSNIFKAGMRLHAYVDKERERYIKKNKVKSLLKEIPKKTCVLFLKILEDEILWDQIDKNTTISAMEIIYPEEVDSGVGEQAVQDWHHEMSRYFRQRPSEFLQALAEQNKPFLSADPATVKDWARLLPLYAKEACFIEYTENMTSYVARKF